MNFSEWDKLENAIAESVLAKSIPIAEAIGMACREHNAAPAKLLLLAATSVVSNAEAFFIPKTNEERLIHFGRYKVIAALAADVVVLQVEHDTCRDLSAFWAATDDSFFSA